jgi:cyanate lyase
MRQKGVDKSMKADEIRSRVAKKGLTMGDFAKQLGIDRASVFRKLNGSSEFTIGEAQKAKDALELTDQEAVEIFLN